MEKIESKLTLYYAHSCEIGTSLIGVKTVSDVQIVCSISTQGLGHLLIAGPDILGSF